jgi:hypothetical protein
LRLNEAGFVAGESVAIECRSDELIELTGCHFRWPTLTAGAALSAIRRLPAVHASRQNDVAAPQYRLLM